MVVALSPCNGCRRHVRVTEQHCPFCGAALAPHDAVAELRLLTPLNRSRLVAWGAVLSAAGIALGCREPAVAVYGAPPPREDTSAPALSAEPSPSPPAPSAEVAPSASVAEPLPPSTTVIAPVPAPKPTTAPKPVPSPRGPDQMLAPAYGGPPRQLSPSLEPNRE